MQKSFEETRKIALEVLKNESEAIQNLSGFINEEFYEAVKLIHACSGRVIVTGIGKSAIIANKIVATFNSTGTRAIFMHAADAVHGDLGMITGEDVVTCLSKSGNSPEIKVLIPLLKNAGNKLIAIAGNKDSYLAHQADYFINATIEEEACPNNLAPTTSTTVQMVLGDALAVCLMNLRNFGSKDFAKYHPGGTLGKKLYLRVSDIYGQNPKPRVLINSSLKEIIYEISSKRLGAAVVEEDEEIVGMITDGDLRRMLSKVEDISGITAKDIMSTEPKVIDEHEMAIKALEIMRELKISQLIVTRNNKYLGMIHIHDLNREGLI